MDHAEAVEMPDPKAVVRRLEQLGVPLDLLHEALRYGYLSGDWTTKSHPRFYQGVRVYSEINGHLREQLGAIGWGLNDDDNIARAISPDGTVVLTAVRGDRQTGLRHGRDAQTLRPRKEAGIRIVRRNSQFVLLPMLPVNDPELVAGDEPVVFGPTWFFLYNRAGSIVRSELSLAKGITGGGTLLQWQERLILPEIDLSDGGPVLNQRTPTLPVPDLDVPVQRRAG